VKIERTSVFWAAVSGFLALCWLASAAEIPETTGYPAGDYTTAVDNAIIIKFRQPVADAVEKQLKAKTPPEKLRLSKALDTLNAQFKVKTIRPLFKNFKENRHQLNALQVKNYALLTENERHILRRLNRAPKGLQVPALDRIYKLQVELPQGQSLQDVVEAYKSNPDVEYAEPDYIVSICRTPNDPLYPIQWPLNNIGQMYPESGRFTYPPRIPDSDIDAPQAWDVNTGNSEIIVAVVDTGVDYTHRDLAGNMWVNADEIGGNGIDDDGNGYIDDIHGYDFCTYGGKPRDPDPMDDHGHGTHCAGVIAAEGNNGFDMAGVCWHASIMAVKFLGPTGSGYESDAVAAFYYAIENGADITSHSWGTIIYSKTLKQTIDYAHSQGMITVAAAGNGGTTDPIYPAYYEHVISVAATNSSDQQAPFSSYGPWVDIAAPGVDILSLRAAGTSLGTIYNQYTTVLSGTSMACPHVAGACAAILSIDQTISTDQLQNILMLTTDPITRETCASGRLNLYSTMLRMRGPQGTVWLDGDAYSCSALVKIKLFDTDLNGSGVQQVTISTEEGDLETVLLAETSTVAGIFTGTISTVSGVPNIGDGQLQLSHGQIITATYHDANDGTGKPAISTDTATADCQDSTIFNVQIDARGPVPAVSFETGEPTTALILYSQTCGDPNSVVAIDPLLTTSHVIKLSPVSPQTDYFFIVEANDAVGNHTIDDNMGRCYALTTDGAGDIHVPAQYPTIQQAIDRSWNGGTVRVADGTYTGDGNRDIDFHGKAITVRSETGPENCIIDCQGTVENPHRGFYLHSGEGANSTVAGFTIKNGYAYGSSTEAKNGGGIYCINSSPTIINCIITKNSAAYDGGGMHNKKSSPTITNCAFIANSAIGNDGGGMNNHQSNTLVSNCIFTNNSAYDWGGGMRNVYSSSSAITNCTFIGNLAGGKGGAIFNWDKSTSTITNCTFIANSSVKSDGGAMNNDHSSSYILNSAFIGNSAGGNGGALCNYTTCNLIITNCTFASNSAASANALACDSIRQTYPSSLQISNCIFWNGSGEIRNNDHSSINITHSNIQDGWPGIGNINADPCFVDPCSTDYHLLENSPCINAGDPDYIPLSGETDLDGRPRILLGRIDMGAYEFNHIPVANAGPDQTVFAGPDCTAEVTLDASASYDEDGDQLTYTWKLNGQIIPPTGGDGIINMLDYAVLTNQWSQDAKSTPDLSDLIKAWLGTPTSPNWNPQCDVAPAGPIATISLPAGENHIQLVVNDGIDNSEPDEVVITVLDNTPPEFTLSVTPAVLWPPNHKMVKITPTWTLTDNCDQSPQVTLVSITSSEADNGLGDGDTSGDIEIRDDGSIYLRAERNNPNTSRIYTITYQAVDDSGNATTSSATVTVPHDRRRPR